MLIYNAVYDCVANHCYVSVVYRKYLRNYLLLRISIMDAALMVTSTTTSATRSYLLLASPLMRENPDTAQFKSPAGEDEAATAQ